MPIDLSQYISLDEIHGKVCELFGCQWAGVPLPVPDIPMDVHPSYPFASQMANPLKGSLFVNEEGEPLCDPEPDDNDSGDEATWINTWFSHRLQGNVSIWVEASGKRFFTVDRYQRIKRLAKTALVAQVVWSAAAELRAQRKLKRCIERIQYEDYLLTGEFFEFSRRSHILYRFRRSRPTLAFSATADPLRILCALCSHPIGYYCNTFAGAMVPTDDVISHLLLMRADEHRFWRISNQHQPWDELAGL